jgi:hypothetical protein
LGGRPRRFLLLELLELFSTSAGAVRGVVMTAVGAGPCSTIWGPTSPGAEGGGCWAKGTNGEAKAGDSTCDGTCACALSACSLLRSSCSFFVGRPLFLRGSVSAGAGSTRGEIGWWPVSDRPVSLGNVAGCFGASGRPIGVNASAGAERFREGPAEDGKEKLVGP